MAIALTSSQAFAQGPAAAANGDRPPLGNSFTVDALGALPASASVFPLLETAVPDVIVDRMDTGGLGAGQPVRAGAHGSTWTQTTYRVGDADVTDPSGSGTPLLSPGVAEWERVDVSTGIMPSDANAPGLAIALVPRRPAAAWRPSLDVFGSPPFLNSGASSGKPAPLERLNTWAHGNFVAGGPVAADRVAAFLSAAWTRSSHFEREAPAVVDATLASGFLTLTATPRAADLVRIVGWAQRAHVPLPNHAALGQPAAAERDRALHAQAALDHQLASVSAGLRVFGSYTVRGRTADLHPSGPIVIERLFDGPVPALLDAGDGVDSVLNAGARFSGSAGSIGQRRHALLAGAELTRGASTDQAAFTGRVGERVNGIPARAWDLSDPAAESHWRSLTVSAFASDTIAVASRATVNAGVRVEAVRGWAADGAPAAVSWQGIYPRAGVHVTLTDFWNIATFAQYGRYGHRLALGSLAYGDPVAPTGLVYRWNGGNLALPASIGPVVQRVGPGTGGNPAFSSVDPDLRRPVMDEMIFGFEARPHPAVFARMAAIARRESPLIGVVDVGVPESAYSTITVPDTGIDRVGSDDDQLLVFYNRPVSSFGADRYLLTNPADHVATFVGVDFVGEVHAKRLFLIAGGTAGRSEGLSASRGFGPLENDAAVLGEVFVDPNARGHAQGRVFTERGYTLKTALSYRFDHDLALGVIGRYQDGQHFARLVVLDGLNQGAEAVRAFRNGRTRFTFTMTVDGRLEKGFAFGGRRLAVVADAYNVFNQALSVEELQVTGAAERQSTAVQPPRSVHIGVRIPF